MLSVLQEAQAEVVFHVASYGMSGRDMVSTCSLQLSIKKEEEWSL